MLEVELCDQFRAALPSAWVVYPETCGWDMLIVRRGVQVGIQSKLRPNLEVLAQAADEVTQRGAYTVGPRYRAVLLPAYPPTRFCDLARALRLVVLVVLAGRVQVSGRPVYRPRPRDYWGPSQVDWRWYRRPHQPLTLPPVVPLVEAGVPSPRTVSAWMVAAIRLERLALAQGTVTVADARAERDRVGGRWNPSTMLSKFFRHAPPPRGRWVPMWSPSKDYPAAVESMAAEVRGVAADI